MRLTTEQEKVLRILQRYPKRGISSGKLWKLTRSKNMPSIIHQLKKKGWKIETERVKKYMSSYKKIYKLTGKTSEKQVRKYMTINRF